MQRERYPFEVKRTRLQSYPTLVSNPRAYDRDVWSLPLVKTYMSQFVFRRKVENYELVTLFANTYSVGCTHARRQVEIRIDPDTTEWIVTDEQGSLLRRLPAKELDDTLIHQLQLAKQRKPDDVSSL